MGKKGGCNFVYFGFDVFLENNMVVLDVECVLIFVRLKLIFSFLSLDLERWF